MMKRASLVICVCGSHSAFKITLSDACSQAGRQICHMSLARFEKTGDGLCRTSNLSPRDRVDMGDKFELGGRQKICYR